MYFHSDSNNNDWGARLFAYGIMQVRMSRMNLRGDTLRALERLLPLPLVLAKACVRYVAGNTKRMIGFCASLFAQEPSAEERADRREKQKEFGNPETEMACWLLEALAQDADGDYAKSILYQRGTLETLVRYDVGGGNLAYL